MTDDHGPTALQPPYLMAALICDDVLEEKDRRLTILRLVTDVTIQVESTTPLPKMPTLRIPLTVVTSFNAGGKPGAYEVRLKVINPAGEDRLGPPSTMELAHDHFSMNLITKLQLDVKAVGVYWIGVLLDGREVTRIPLDVHYASKQTAQLKAAAGAEQNSPRESR